MRVGVKEPFFQTFMEDRPGSVRHEQAALLA
jgi:hypothetical protein